MQDDFIDKEDNSRLFVDTFFKWLLTDDLDEIDMAKEEQDLSEYNFIPDTAVMAEQLRCCL